MSIAPLARTATVLGSYVVVTYEDGEVARMHKDGFIAPLCAPDFYDIAITDDGETLKMGEYEVDTRALYRLEFEE